MVQTHTGRSVPPDLVSAAIPTEGHPRRLARRGQHLHTQLDLSLKQLAQTNQHMLGQAVQDFEQTTLSLWGNDETAACIGMGSGSSALQGILECLRFPEGAEIITSPYTFIATWMAISRALTVTEDGILRNSLVCVCVDIDPQTLTLDARKVEAAITDKTVAIIPVHMNGIMADMQPILEIAQKYHLYVIEDACQAHGATYTNPVTSRTSYAGMCGHFGFYSFNAVKNAGCFDSDAGLVTVAQKAVQKHPSIIEDLRAYRNAGRTTSHRYNHQKLGTRSRLGEYNAMEVSEELKLLDSWNRERQKIAAGFVEACTSSPSGILPPQVPKDRTHVYFNFVVRSPCLEVQSELEHCMQQAGIPVANNYSLISDQLPYCQAWFPWRMASGDVAQQVTPLLTHIPCFPELYEEERERIKSVLSSV